MKIGKAGRERRQGHNTSAGKADKRTKGNQREAGKGAGTSGPGQGQSRIGIRRGDGPVRQPRKAVGRKVEHGKAKNRGAWKARRRAAEKPLRRPKTSPHSNGENPHEEADATKKGKRKATDKARSNDRMRSAEKGNKKGDME